MRQSNLRVHLGKPKWGKAHIRVGHQLDVVTLWHRAVRFYMVEARPSNRLRFLRFPASSRSPTSLGVLQVTIGQPAGTIRKLQLEPLPIHQKEQDD